MELSPCSMSNPALNYNMQQHGNAWFQSVDLDSFPCQALSSSNYIVFSVLRQVVRSHPVYIKIL